MAVFEPEAEGIVLDVEETGGDSVTMSWLKADVVVNAGYLVGSAIFLSALIVLVVIAKNLPAFLDRHGYTRTRQALERSFGYSPATAS